MIPALTSRIVRDVESLRRLLPEWNELWQRCENLTSFQRPEWLVPWVEVFQPTDLRIVEVRRAHELVGLAPMFRYRWGSEHVLAPLGAGITDYLDWIIIPELAVEVVAQILACLRDSNEMWDWLDLPDIRAGSCLLKHVELFGFQPTAHEACPTLRFPRDATSRLTIFSERQRKNLRTAHNRSRKAGFAEIEVADRKRLPEFLDALLRLHTARWQEFGRPGVLCDEVVQRFHERVTPGLFDAGILRLYGLRFEGDLVAVLYVLWDREAAYFYLQGFDPAYAFISPGAQVIAAAIEDAVEHGRRVIDFLRGREAYKYSWGATDLFTRRLQMTRGEILQHLSNLEQQAA